jgi:sodium/bile acid cotransporter 7
MLRPEIRTFLFVPALVLAIVYIILAADPGGKIDRAVLAGYILTSS